MFFVFFVFVFVLLNFCYKIEFNLIGVLPSKASAMFMMEAFLGFLDEGAYFLRGGPSEVPFQIIPIIEQHGGRVLVQAKVTDIILDKSNRAIGKCLFSRIIMNFLSWWL